MKKKSFKTSPALNFISQETVDRVDSKEEAPAKLRTLATQTAPEGYKSNPLYIETKSKRIQALLQPSVYKLARAKAENEGISFNELVNRALRAYILSDEEPEE